MDIPKRLRPLRPTQIVDDASFMGAHDTNLSRQTAAYALRACGNTAHYVYSSVYSAPKAYVSTLASWTDFEFLADYNVTFEVPWHHQRQHAAIGGQLRVATQSRGFASVRLQSDQLIDAVASTESSGINALPSEQSNVLGWNKTTGNVAFAGEVYLGSSWRIMTYRLQLRAPTLPANRRIVVRPQIQMSGLAALFIGVVSAKYYVESLALWDEPDPDTHA